MFDWLKSLIELVAAIRENGLVDVAKQFWARHKKRILVIGALAVIGGACFGVYWNLSHSYSLKNGVLTIYKPLFSSQMYAYQYDKPYERIIDGEMRYEIRISSTPWFDDRESIKTVVIQDGVTHISSAAFAECSNLKDLHLPKSLISIGDYAFNNCVSLESVPLPDSVSDIGKYAFNQCVKLTEVYFIYKESELDEWLASMEKTPVYYEHSGDGNAGKIGNGAFLYCKKLKSIIIPDGVTSIGVRAFAGCSALEGVIIPDGVISIGDFAFLRCVALEGVIIPNGVTSIGKYAFAGCSALKSVLIPDSVTSIGSVAFHGCSALTSVEAPADADCENAFDSWYTTVTRRAQ